MSVINDIYEKAKNWHEPTKVTIYAEDHAEKLTCSICGKIYISRGKHDPGYCKECEADQSAVCIGGPCNGEKANGK